MIRLALGMESVPLGAIASRARKASIANVIIGSRLSSVACPMSYSLLDADRTTHRKIFAVATAATVAFVLVGATARLPTSTPRTSAGTFFEQGRINLYAKVPTRPSSQFAPTAAPQMPLRFALSQPSDETDSLLARGPKQDRLIPNRIGAAHSVVIRTDPDLNTTYAIRLAPAIEVKTRKTLVCESPFGGALTLTDRDVFARCVASGPASSAVS
jgi:hypothetical protein